MAGDTYWQNVWALAKMEDGDASTSVADEKRGTWTVTGSLSEVTTDQAKFGAGSFLTNGSLGSLQLSSLPNLQSVYGVDDWCIDFWAAPVQANEANGRLFQTRNGDFVTGISLIVAGTAENSDLDLYVSDDGSTWNLINGTTVLSSPTSDQWYHFAFIFTGGTLYLAIDGSIVASTAYSGDLVNTSPWIWGGQSISTSRNAGWAIDEPRVTVGHKRFDETGFTAPTAEAPITSADGTTWLPTEEPGRTKWYDINSPNSTDIVESAGVLQTLYNRVSGGVDYWSQGTASARPDIIAASLNSLDYIDFVGGTSDNMISPTANLSDLTGRDFIMCCVMKSDVAHDSGTTRGLWTICANAMNGGSSELDTYYPHSTGVCYDHFGSKDRFNMGAPPGTNAIDSWHVYGVKADGTSWTSYINGEEWYDSGTAPTIEFSRTNFGWGRTQSSFQQWYGEDAEMVIMEWDGTDLQREKLEGYLAHKYGLEANLPSGHTYASAPPTVGAGGGGGGTTHYLTAKRDALRTLGYTGSTFDMENAWLRAQTGVTAKQTPQAWKEHLIQLGYSGKPVQEMKWEYFGDLGYTGSLQQREVQFWSNL